MQKVRHSKLLQSMQRKLNSLAKKIQDSEILLQKKTKILDSVINQISENKANIRVLQCRSRVVCEELNKITKDAINQDFQSNSKSKNLIIHVNSVFYDNVTNINDFIKILFNSYLQADLPKSAILLGKNKSGFTSILVRFTEAEQSNFVLKQCPRLKNFPCKISICRDVKARVKKSKHIRNPEKQVNLQEKIQSQGVMHKKSKTRIIIEDYGATSEELLIFLRDEEKQTRDEEPAMTVCSGALDFCVENKKVAENSESTKTGSFDDVESGEDSLCSTKRSSEWDDGDSSVFTDCSLNEFEQNIMDEYYNSAINEDYVEDYTDEEEDDGDGADDLTDVKNCMDYGYMDKDVNECVDDDYGFYREAGSDKLARKQMTEETAPFTLGDLKEILDKYRFSYSNKF